MVTATYVERQMRAGDLKLNYQEWGDPAAPTILMVHGFGVSGHMFDEFAERAMDRFHLLALDQRGHGDSDWAADGDYSRDAFVNDIEALRAALGLERFILMGHSMGGLNAVTYAVRHPHRLRALVVVDAGPEAAKDGVENIMRFTRGPDELEFEEFVEMAHRFNPRRSMENIRERMRHRLRQQDNGKWTWKFDRRFRQADAPLRIGSELTNDEMWQLYRAVEAPTLLVRGAESDVLSQAVAERAAHEMPRCRLAVIPGAGHSVPGDNPDDFTAAVRLFLSDLESGLFAPETDAIPPLEELVETHGRRARGGSLMPLFVAGVAVAALAGGAWLSSRRGGPRAKTQRPAGPARKPAEPHRLPAVDLDLIRDRARLLAADLAQASRPPVNKARAAAHDLHLERARESARSLLHDLGDRTMATPALVKKAAERAERRGLPGRLFGKKQRSRSGAAKAALRILPSLLGMRGKKQAPRRLAPWRR